MLVAIAGEFVEGGVIGDRIRRVLVELVAKSRTRSDLLNDRLYLLFRSGIQVVAGLVHHLGQLADGCEFRGIVGNRPEHLGGGFNLRARCVGPKRH